MAKIIAFANQKGGVGKTTSAINVAAALGLKRKNTLLVDFDPQGNSTSGVGIRKSQVKNTIYDALVGKASPHDCIIKTEYKNLSVMPSELSLAAAELAAVLPAAVEEDAPQPVRTPAHRASAAAAAVTRCQFLLVALRIV